ncbi:MAG TPA: hypothetical protein VH041_05275 [Caldimonas sp.]|nr:hypothetical protein [Caldimonas sp.]HEX4233696.1 hypothetical protein [Caldimonas sp.]
MPTLLAVRLYPLNAEASKGRLLTAQVVATNAGHGITFTVPYLGDTLRGESTRVDARGSTGRCSAIAARAPVGAESRMRSAPMASILNANTC